MATTQEDELRELMANFSNREKANTKVKNSQTPLKGFTAINNSFSTSIMEKLGEIYIEESADIEVQNTNALEYDSSSVLAALAKLADNEVSEDDISLQLSSNLLKALNVKPLSVEELTSQPNTLADIRDTAWEITNLETREVTLENLNREVNSLESSLFTIAKYQKRSSSQEDTIYLDEFIDKLPHGIFDKRITGIGATTLEIKAKRHSIIVMPTKRLAYNKHKANEGTIYIGSFIEGLKNSSQDIQKYTLDTSIEYKKYIVVADSLGALISELQSTRLFPDIYREVFLMVDEIDQMQEDSSFRTTLEGVIDYYFRFHYKQRVLVSATVQPFSNPKLQKECRFEVDSIISKSDSEKVQLYSNRECKLITTNHIPKALIDYLSHIPKEEKVLIAFNAVREAYDIIQHLTDDLKEECAILCSDSRENDVKNYFNRLIDNKLPSRINFMTSAYFSGIDIYDSYHLCTINNANNSIQLISIVDFIQIYGRCREPYKVLSDTIIFKKFEARKKAPKDVDSKKNSSSTKKKLPNKRYIHSELLKKADKLIELFQAMNQISANDKVIATYFEQIKEKIALESMGFIYNNRLTLIRKNIDNDYVPAYFAIDYLLSRYDSYNNYRSTNDFKKYLNTINIDIVESKLLTFKNISDNYNKKLTRKELQQQDEKYIQEIIDIINSNKDNVEVFHSLLVRLLYKNKNKRAKTFLERYIECYQVVESDLLIEELLNIKLENATSYKNMFNSIVFSRLEENHPFKISIYNNFEIGKSYTSEEICNIISKVYAYHETQTISNKLIITLFRCFFNTNRTTNNYYIINDYNVFESHIIGKRIISTEKISKYLK